MRIFHLIPITFPTIIYISNHISVFVFVSGVLCGSCREGKGVSALTRSCVSCHRGFTSFIAGLSELSVVTLTLS